MNGNGTLRQGLDRLERRALVVGVAGLALSLGGAFLSPTQFLRSYLVSYIFWSGLALGSLGLLMLHHLAGGRWGYVIRRPLEASTRTLPLIAVLFLPFLINLQALYPWARPETVASDALLQHKSSYLNVPFFVGRTVIYFAIWLGMAYLLNKWSAEDDNSAEPRHWHRFRVLSGPGILVYGLTVSFAAVDWAMSVEPEWFSTMYGILYVTGQVLATLAFMVIILMLLAREGPLAEAASANQFHNLGNLLLAFVMLWAYMSFSQFLIIWSGNLPEEIPWYLHRTGHGWQWLALLLVGFHFAVPFLLLLSRATKRRAQTLAAVAGGIFVLRAADIFWQVAPAFHGTEVRVHWLDPVILVGMGGLWLALFLRQLKKRPLLARHDAAIEDWVEEGAEA